MRLSVYLPLSAVALSASSLAANYATTYPDKSYIANVFNFLHTGNTTQFLSFASPTVAWTIMGTHPLAGTYNNRTLFAIDALARLESTASTADLLKANVVNIVGGGDEEWSVEELKVDGTLKNGLIFNNTYSWVTRWSTDGIIVEARACLDSALVSKTIVENESGLFHYYENRTALKPGPVGLGCQNA